MNIRFFKAYIMNPYHPCSKEFQAEAKRLGLSGNELIQKYKRDGILKTDHKVDRERIEEFAKNNGFSCYKEYQKDCYKRNPEYYIDYSKNRYYYNEGGSPFEENENCNNYFGNLNEELFNRYLRKYFDNVHWNHLVGRENKNRINFIVSGPKAEFLDKYPIFKRYFLREPVKIALLSRLIDINNNSWGFTIDYNNVADFFLLVAWIDERIDRVWLIPRNARIRKGSYGNMVEFYKREKKIITNKPDYISENSRWELDKLEVK